MNRKWYKNSVYHVGLLVSVTQTATVSAIWAVSSKLDYIKSLGVDGI